MVDAHAPADSDIALFLHTSGTTSRPKGVPLRHLNLMRSLENIKNTYALTPDDTSLIVMPLFHVHGLIGATLSTLNSGGTVVVPPRFSASAFWQQQSEDQLYVVLRSPHNPPESFLHELMMTKRRTNLSD